MIKIKIYNFIFAFMLVLMSVGCDDFLTEVSVTDITANSYIINEAGYEDLVKAGYPTLRDIILQYRLVLPGTDIF
ncbi:MAG: RagB/SusD family nutrient uptake outer membrane protein, partial [Cyclobacteriaceae bacterium]